LSPPLPDAPKKAQAGKNAGKKSEAGGERKATASASGSDADRTRELVQSRGLLKILGSKGTGNSPLSDVLGESTGAADIGAALAGARGVGVATTEAVGATGPKGGGKGKVAGIGDLGTSGGGKVNLGTKGDVAVRGTVKDSAPVLDDSSVNPEELARYVRQRKSAIQSCYEKELKRNPTLKGRIVVRFVISSQGRAGEIEIEENTLGNEAVGACIRNVVRLWVFPFKPQDGVAVAYPFVFSPAG
jgi:hypothetical protein